MNGHTHQTHFAKGSFKAVCGYFLYNKSIEAYRTIISNKNRRSGDKQSWHVIVFYLPAAVPKSKGSALPASPLQRTLQVKSLKNSSMRLQLPQQHACRSPKPQCCAELMRVCSMLPEIVRIYKRQLDSALAEIKTVTADRDQKADTIRVLEGLISEL